MPHNSPTNFAALRRCHRLFLTSFRYDGQPVTTSVEFAQDGDHLYVALPANANIVQRVHGNAQVEVASCESDAPPMEAMAVVLPPDKSTAARRAVLALGWRQRLLELLTQRVYLEITPM